MRLTVTTCTDDPTELATVEAWFHDYAAQITAVGENEGCGCCVNIWTVEATPGAFAALPDCLKSITAVPPAS